MFMIMICLDIKFQLPGFSSLLHLYITNKIKTKGIFARSPCCYFLFQLPPQKFAHCHVDMMSYRKREVRYQVGFEPHNVHTKFHKNVSSDFQQEVGADAQRRDVKVCFFHFRNDNRLQNGHRLKFMPQTESEHLLPVCREPYFILW